MYGQGDHTPLFRPTSFLSYFLPTVLWRGVRAAWWALAGQLRSIHYSAVGFHSLVDCWCLWLWKESAMALPRLRRTHSCRLACSWGERQLSSPGMGKRQKLPRNHDMRGKKKKRQPPSRHVYFWYTVLWFFRHPLLLFAVPAESVSPCSCQTHFLTFPLSVPNLQQNFTPF